MGLRGPASASNYQPEEALAKNQSLPNMTATKLEASYHVYHTPTCGGTSYGSPCMSSFYYKFSHYAPVDMGSYWRGCATADHDQRWCYTTNQGWGNCYCR